MKPHSIQTTLRISLAALGLLLLSGCASTHYEAVDPDRSFEATQAVEVFETTPARPHTVIGMVSASSDKLDAAALLESLKQKAMAVGAEGIILQETASELATSSDPAAGGGEFVTSRMVKRLSAQAVRFK